MRDFGDHIARPEIAITNCPATEAGALLLGKMAAVSGTTYEHVTLAPDLTAEQRHLRLKRVDAEHLVVVRCAGASCSSAITVAAGTEMYGVEPTVLQSERQTTVLYDGGEWIDHAPLVVVHQQVMQEAL